MMIMHYYVSTFKLITLRCCFTINVLGYVSHYLVNESIIHLQMEAGVAKRTHSSEIRHRRRRKLRTFQCRGLNCEFMCSCVTSHKHAFLCGIPGTCIVVMVVVVIRVVVVSSSMDSGDMGFLAPIWLAVEELKAVVSSPGEMTVAVD